MEVAEFWRAACAFEGVLAELARAALGHRHQIMQVRQVGQTVSSAARGTTTCARLVSTKVVGWSRPVWTKAGWDACCGGPPGPCLGRGWGAEVALLELAGAYGKLALVALADEAAP